MSRTETVENDIVEEVLSQTARLDNIGEQVLNQVTMLNELADRMTRAQEKMDSIIKVQATRKQRFEAFREKHPSKLKFCEHKLGYESHQDKYVTRVFSCGKMHTIARFDSKAEAFIKACDYMKSRLGQEVLQFCEYGNSAITEFDQNWTDYMEGVKEFMPELESFITAELIFV